MLRKGFLRLHQSAEAAGYPALLVVVMVALTVIVSGIVLVAMMNSVPALALTLVCFITSIAVVAGGIDAMFSDVEEPGAERTSTASAAAEPGAVVPLLRRNLADAKRPRDRRAA